MIFGKKNANEGKVKCDSCGTKIDKGYKFCPYCGVSFIDLKKEREDFGLLGKNDLQDQNLDNSFSLQGFGITDKLINTVFNSLMKNLDKQMKNQFIQDKGFEKTEIRSFPNGIGIKIYGPFPMQPIRKQKKKEQEVQKINDAQLRRMSELPRQKAKANVKRIGDKVIYELVAQGITSIEDVFVSKVETGYEIKAIGDKKIYVNNIPINLPLRKYSITEDKLLFEFVSS